MADLESLVVAALAIDAPVVTRCIRRAVNYYVTDDEKYIFSEKHIIEAVQIFTSSIAKEIIAVRTFFLEDDEELESTRVAYAAGKMLTGELKAKCIGEIQEYVKGFQERRVMVMDEMVKDFMARKKPKWKGNPTKEDVGGEAPVDGAQKLTKNQEKKLAKMKAIEEKKAAAKGDKA
ncbi:uncharacterized protein BP5553_04992 [Venustampulla echinocandica]|uniref:Uncharacterized protein n=1 Tax=Venustampulla echinocandica TaxID=2656787 RepID=A0A370TPW0_9HELO|nr:uncharacterized protein BP5553_04992 [Venustampulla echinocandica]RDL37559.1 hypothetical protein BP5553_04992 [Venustampulla echinocandica]